MIRAAVVFVAAALTLPATRLSSQQSRAAGLIADARAQLQANRPDSAVALLRRAVDTSAGPSADRIQAWVLLGVIRFYQAGDTAARPAFREALKIDPALRATGLAQVDSQLPRLLEAERAALAPEPGVVTAPPSVPASTPDSAAVATCIRRCRGGELKPRRLDMPTITMLDFGVFQREQTRGFVVVQAIIGTDGTPEPESIRVTASNVRGLDAQVLQVVRQAHFEPAVGNGRPVRALVELRFEFRAVGTNTLDYSVTGP
jgi:TonB family protein